MPSVTAYGLLLMMVEAVKETPMLLTRLVQRCLLSRGVGGTESEGRLISPQKGGCCCISKNKVYEYSTELYLPPNS